MLQGFGDAGTQCVDSGTDTDTGTNSRSMAWNCFFSSFSQHGGGHVVGAGVPARHAAFGVPPDKPWGGQALQVPEILKDSSGCVPHAQIIHHIVKKEKYECGQSEAEALPREPARQAGASDCLIRRRLWRSLWIGGSTASERKMGTDTEEQRRQHGQRAKARATETSFCRPICPLRVPHHARGLFQPYPTAISACGLLELGWSMVAKAVGRRTWIAKPQSRLVSSSG